jgi:hypothetical protein
MFLLFGFKCQKIVSKPKPFQNLTNAAVREKKIRAKKIKKFARLATARAEPRCQARLR